MRDRRVTVLEPARCERCGRRLLAGERAAFDVKAARLTCATPCPPPLARAGIAGRDNRSATA